MKNLYVLWITFISFQCFEVMAQDELTSVDNDFVPGQVVLFEDKLEGEQIGEFPSKWDVKSGTIENMKMGEETVIGFRTKGEIFPYMTTPAYLSEKFTIEFDCHFNDYGNEAYYIILEGIEKIRVNIDGLKWHSDQANRIKVKSRKGWRRVQLSFNKRALKVYYEGVRLINIPKLDHQPTKVHFSALSHGVSKDLYAMIKNIRIAEGAVPLYNRLMTDGKFVTNDILFDTNSDIIKPESKKIIQQVATMLKEHSDMKVTIEGHTDSDGSDAANLSLSQKRAAAVKLVLAYEGVLSSQLLIKGLGESQPIATNTTPEGKAKNRRVEFVLLK